MKNLFKTVFAAGLACGCATTEVERLEKAIVEKDYIADEEVERLENLAKAEIAQGKSAAAQAALDRILPVIERREKWYCKKLCADIETAKAEFSPCGHWQTPREKEYCAFLFDVTWHNARDDETRLNLYGHAASNSLWYALDSLPGLYLQKDRNHAPGKAYLFASMYAAQGSPSALATLGKFAEAGIGTEKALEKAAEYYFAAAETMATEVDEFHQGEDARDWNLAANMRNRYGLDMSVYPSGNSGYSLPDAWIDMMEFYGKAAELGHPQAARRKREMEERFGKMAEKEILLEKQADEKAGEKAGEEDAKENAEIEEEWWQS